MIDNIETFDLNSINENCDSFLPSFLFTGIRDTGKTHLIQKILKNHISISSGIVFGVHSDIYYRSFADTIKTYHNKYEETETYEENTNTSRIVNKFIDEQKQIYKNEKNYVNEHEPDCYDKRKCLPKKTIIFNDLQFLKCDALCKKSYSFDSIRQLLMNGKHWNIMTMIEMQYPIRIPSDLYIQFDYSFIFRILPIRSELLTNVYKNHESAFKTFESFNKHLKLLTKPYDCLVVDIKKNKVYIMHSNIDE